MFNELISNESLITKLKNGDEQAYTFLIDKFHHKLCVYANTLLNDHATAEDIVQNVFIKVWERRQSLKEELSIQSFLYKSVHNEFIDHYRKHKYIIALEKKHISILSKITQENDDTFIEKLHKKVTFEVQQLPPKYKHTFLLSKQEGLSNIEISEYLGVSIKTVEAHITKAFSIIRDKIESKNKTELL